MLIGLDAATVGADNHIQYLPILIDLEAKQENINKEKIKRY